MDRHGTSTSTLTVGHGHALFMGEDNKYGKRKSQDVARRFRQALGLLSVAILLLIWTLVVLAADSIEQSTATSTTKSEYGVPGPQHNHKQGMGEKARHKHKKNKQGTKDNNSGGGGGGGMFGGLFGSEHMTELEEELKDLDHVITENTNGGIRWARPELLPALHPNQEKPLLEMNAREKMKWARNPERFFAAKRSLQAGDMAWEHENHALEQTSGPLVDFTKHNYVYPEKRFSLPPLGEYPRLRPTKELMETWPQEDIDHPPTPFKEELLHFDFTDPTDLKAARLFRDAKLPFKLVNVPELLTANEKWTDDYLSEHFDSLSKDKPRTMPRAKGTCQESSDSFFAFYAQNAWPVQEMGLPPTRNNDWTFEAWAQHAKYADTHALHPHQPHFYYQSGVDREERHMQRDQWTFISRDLPSFSSPTETFMVFEPESQKGIQCRFGERGVAAATHFDSGRNMVGMISGAKRYILQPPNQCSRLGIVNSRVNPVFRHSMLNFGHLNNLDDPDMPEEEREWLERASQAMAVETVLKAGEVLYIPSFWFHYIISLQKSAQCNVRSGIDTEGDAYFGGKVDAMKHCDPRLETA